MFNAVILGGNECHKLFIGFIANGDRDVSRGRYVMPKSTFGIGLSLKALRFHELSELKFRAERVHCLFETQPEGLGQLRSWMQVCYRTPLR